MRIGVLISIDSRKRSAISAAHCPNERILESQSAARQIHLCPSQPHYGLQPAMFSGNDSVFLVASITRY